MQEASKNTKLKVIGGYSLLFLLTLLSTILIYKQITKLIVNEGNSGDTSRRLFIVSNTINNLYEAETISNAFIQTGMSKYFRKYVEILDRTEQNIDTLRYMTTRLEQISRLDSINNLLDNKMHNLQDLVYVKRSFVPEDFYNKAIASIESGKDSLPTFPDVRPRYITTFDTSYIKIERKKRRRNSEPDSILNVTRSYHIVYDTLNSPQMSSLRNTDTVVNILRNTWQNVQKQNKDINKQISAREYALIKQSTNISDKLKRILSEYEKEEIHHATRKQETREKTVTTMIHIFAVVAATAFLLVVFFTFFILRDLSRSNRYRRELESANRYADQLLKSREKMILTVTHDIKAPLSSILGYIELLTNTPVSERQRYFLKNMQGSSNHILKLVGNLLDFSKLENNKMQVEEVVFNPARLFQEIIDNFMPLAANKNLELQSKFGKDLNSDFKGDALRIRQIITNILSNAVKYTVEGRIRFTAVTTTDDKRIVLKIEDTGSGMTSEEQKTIFEELTRLKSHSAIEGTGLGLTLTLKLIHLLQGEMKLESEPGKGSCFTISLPLLKAPAGSTPPTPAKVTTIPTNREAKNLQVLLVDDDPLQLAMTSNLLSNLGIHTATTTNPTEVVTRLKSSHYDLMFSDIQMPEMSGFDLVKLIRSLPDGLARELPIVALSADADKTEDEYIKAGFTAYLSKPFRSAQLVQLITRLTQCHITQKIPAENIRPQEQTRIYTLKNIAQFTDNDPEALRSILHDFISSTDEHIKQLAQFREQKQWDGIPRLAHKMLPLFRQLEAVSIVEILQKLEHPDKANISQDYMDTLTAKVIKLIAELQNAIKNEDVLQVHTAM